MDMKFSCTMAGRQKFELSMPIAGEHATSEEIAAMSTYIKMLLHTIRVDGPINSDESFDGRLNRWLDASDDE